MLNNYAKLTAPGARSYTSIPAFFSTNYLAYMKC